MNIHLIGAGGIGMSGLRTLLQKSQISFTASDDANLEDGFLPENIHPIGATKIVVSSAIKKQHPQYTWALKEGIQIVHRSAYTKEIIAKTNSTVISVTGSHGKTTSSALLAWVLSKSDLGASFLIGGHFSGTDISADLKQGAPYFVIEADESDSSMLELKGEISMLTNLSAEHISYYGSFEALVSEINQFVDDSKICFCHSSCKKLIHRRDAGIKFYDADNIELVAMDASGMSFNAVGPWGYWGNLKVGLIGRHMLQNLAGCLEIMHFLGLDEATIRNGLATFPGVKKRLEILDLSDNRRIIKDYAHHPVEVESLISAVLEAYSDRKIHFLWEPHKFSRISYEDNYHHFLRAIARINGKILVLPVWAAGETSDPRFSQEIILADTAKTLLAAGKNAEVFRIASDLDLAEWLKTHFMPGELLLSVGAGGVHKLTDKAYRKLNIKTDEKNFHKL